MLVIRARNVSEALGLGTMHIKDKSITISPRGKETLEYPEPVCTVYERPWERVLFHPARDANPFFHFMESLWILAGRNDVEWIEQFNKNIANYSDNERTFNAAYGFRIRNHFGVDQFRFVIDHLKQDPNSRRAVISMWDPTTDTRDSKDIPCNDLIMFKIRNGKLMMTVSCRSNDMIWGCYGANAVHFSMIHEYVASAIGVPMGAYRQISDSFHVYTDNPKWAELQDRYGELISINPYAIREEELWRDHAGSLLITMPMISIPLHEWHKELEDFVDIVYCRLSLSVLKRAEDSFNDPFFSNVAIPMYRAWLMRENCGSKKEGAAMAAKYLRESGDLAAWDWSKACIEWMERRAAK